ncbi:MAG: hypothetical protein ACKVP4_09565 [Hyphomicrobium sp.]
MRAALPLFAAAAIFALAPLASAQAAPREYELKREKPLPHYGGYSVKKSHTIDTRKFTDPSLSVRAQGQPFDNGFFFETPRGPFGGYTPYMH